MKKDIKYIMMGVAVSAIALAGCSKFQEEDLFDESAALRLEHNSQKLQEILLNAPYGWVMQYHTGSGVAVFEGFNIFAKFEQGGKVTLAGDHRYLRNGNAGRYTEHTSLYEIIREDGLVLAFNTWNDVLTPFVDPVSYWAAPTYLNKDGEGMQGDQNLVVKYMGENELVFRGERYDAEIHMVKADRDWQTYISDTKAMKERITSDNLNSYYIMSGDETMYLVGLKDGRYRMSERVKNPLKVDSLSCCFTPYGFRNERIDTIAGHLFQEFKMNEDGSALVNEDGTVRVIATWDTYLAECEDVMWMDTTSMSPNIKTLYDQLETAIQTIKNTYVLQRVGLGKSQTVSGKDNVLGLVIEWKPGKRLQAKTGGLALKRSVPAMGQMTITYSEGAKIDQELTDAMNSTFEDAVRAFGSALTGTYQLTSNSNFVPTAAQFKSLDGNTIFKIAKE